jgi:hypothetical protein
VGFGGGYKDIGEAWLGIIIGLLSISDELNQAYSCSYSNLIDILD